MPALAQIHIDQALTNLSVMYRNAAYVGDQVLPILPVNKRSNKYFIYRKEDFLSPSLAQNPDRGLIRHRPAGEEERLLLAKQLRDPILQPSRGRISVKDVIPHFSLGDGAPHAHRWFGDGI